MVSKEEGNKLIEEFLGYSFGLSKEFDKNWNHLFAVIDIIESSPIRFEIKCMRNEYECNYFKAHIVSSENCEVLASSVGTVRIDVAWNAVVEYIIRFNKGK